MAGHRTNCVRRLDRYIMPAPQQIKHRAVLNFMGGKFGRTWITGAQCMSHPTTTSAPKAITAAATIGHKLRKSVPSEVPVPDDGAADVICN
jgi:hypothetical protein